MLVYILFSIFFYDNILGEEVSIAHPVKPETFRFFNGEKQKENLRPGKPEDMSLRISG